MIVAVVRLLVRDGVFVDAASAVAVVVCAVVVSERW